MSNKKQQIWAYCIVCVAKWFLQNINCRLHFCSYLRHMAVAEVLLSPEDWKARKVGSCWPSKSTAAHRYMQTWRNWHCPNVLPAAMQPPQRWCPNASKHRMKEWACWQAASRWGHGGSLIAVWLAVWCHAAWQACGGNEALSQPAFPASVSSHSLAFMLC